MSLPVKTSDWSLGYLDAVFWLVAQLLLLMHFTSVSLEGSGSISLVFAFIRSFPLPPCSSLSTVVSGSVSPVLPLTLLHFSSHLFLSVPFPLCSRRPSDSCVGNVQDCSVRCWEKDLVPIKLQIVYLWTD